MTLFLICVPDDQNRWNRKNYPKFFHRVIFAFWIQIYNPNLCTSHTIWNKANIEKCGPDNRNRWNRKKCPKFFYRINFAFWIQFCNPNLCKSHTFWNRDNIWEMSLFRIHGPDDQNRWNRKTCQKFLHSVIFAFWIQICNPHILWNTANIEKWHCFAHADLMSEIDEIGKIAWNSFVW